MNQPISRDSQPLEKGAQTNLSGATQGKRLPPTGPALTGPCVPPPLPTYLVRRGPDQFGPYSFQELQRHALEGRVVPSDMVWSAGMTAWAPVDETLRRLGAQLPADYDRRPDESMSRVMPIGRSGLAIAAGYLGLFSLLVFPAPIALVVSILALRDLKKHPQKMGAGRAWFGLVVGGLGTLVLLSILVLAAFEN